MRTAVERTVQAIGYIVQTVAVGTNMGLAQLLWVMVNGSFLHSRGAVFGALVRWGLGDATVRRSWCALRYGVWDVNELLDNWQMYVASENQWRVRRYEGYRVLSVDITGFWRPHLQGWLGRHYHNLVEKVLPAVVMGVMVLAGEVGEKRIPLLRRIVRSAPEMEKPGFRSQLLQEAAQQAALDQVVVVDAEFSVAELHAAGVAAYVVRLARNATAQRNRLPAYKGRGPRPKYGETVRPLARRWQEREIAATPPDRVATFDHQGMSIAVRSWHNLVPVHTPLTAHLSHLSPYSIYVYTDPRYKHPLVLATNLTLKPETAYLMYLDRWPVEQAPLAAKQMVGLHRHFVSAPEACFRLPELSLLAGAILTYIAAVLPPMPSGFWDRRPAATPGRLRRVLAQADFPNFTDFDPQLRIKNSVTTHLPKGIHAHRRTKRAA
jgi:hypothetical protein